MFFLTQAEKERMAVAPATEVELKCVEELKKAITQSQLDEDDTHFLSDATFLRFARARDGDVQKALHMMTDCVKWRVAFKPHRIKPDDIADILQLGTVFMAGVCLSQRPVMYMMPGAKNPFVAEKRVKLMVFLLEETMRRGFATLTWIFDFSRMGERGKDDQSAATRKDTLHILQNYYPERLGALYMVNTPWYFKVIATLIWPFIDKRTTSKVHISVKVKDLTKYVAESELIEMFGGKRHVRLANEGPLDINEMIPPPLTSERSIYR